jgi:hypothetical protein
MGGRNDSDLLLIFNHFVTLVWLRGEQFRSRSWGFVVAAVYDFWGFAAVGAVYDRPYFVDSRKNGRS